MLENNADLRRREEKYVLRSAVSIQSTNDFIILDGTLYDVTSEIKEKNCKAVGHM